MLLTLTEASRYESIAIQRLRCIHTRVQFTGSKGDLIVVVHNLIGCIARHTADPSHEPLKIHAGA